MRSPSRTSDALTPPLPIQPEGAIQNGFDAFFTTANVLFTTSGGRLDLCMGQDLPTRQAKRGDPCSGTSSDDPSVGLHPIEIRQPGA